MGVNELLRYLVGEVNTKGRSVFRRQIRKNMQKTSLRILKTSKEEGLQKIHAILFTLVPQAQKEGLMLWGTHKRFSMT